MIRNITARRTRLRLEILEDRTAPAITGTVSQFFITHNVDIQSINGVSAAIDPTATTWLVIHGRNDSAVGKMDLAKSIQHARPNDQVLLLDWSEAAASSLLGEEGEAWIVPVANWAAGALTADGFAPSHINIVGHSWGAYVGEELAARMPAGKVNSIVALDPAIDYPFGFFYNPDDGHVNFAAHSNISWAFHAQQLTVFLPLGSFVTPETASEAFTVAGADHNAVVDVFRDLLERPTPISQFLSLDRLVNDQPSPFWIPNKFTFWGATHTLFFPQLLQYEAAIGAVPNPDTSSTITREAASLIYFDAANPNSNVPVFVFADDPGNQPPAIGEVLGPQTIKQGKFLTLAAVGVHDDGAVTGVNFYLDSNGNSSLDSGDAVIGGGTRVGNNWVLTVPTTGWALGNTRIFVQAVDDTGLTQVQEFDLTVVAPPPKPHDYFATGTDFGGDPLVNVYDAASGTSFSFEAYPLTFKGGVRVATGDVNGDGVEDIITGAGPTGGPHIKVFDGVTHAEIRSFFGLDPSFTGGVWVAAGDVNNDGFADIIVGADAGGSPEVRVYSGKDNSLLGDFLAYGPSFTGGVRVASGDFNGDGYADILMAAGPNGGPHVRAISGLDGTDLASFFVYAPTFTGGIFVTAGDTNGDGYDDYITGAGLTGGPHVRAFSGATQGDLQSFFTSDPTFTGGVRVSAADIDGDGKADLITSLGQQGAPQVKVFKGNTLALLEAIQAYDPTYLSGVYVG